MRNESLSIDRIEFPVISLNTLIIGSGAAALNAASRLFEYGQKDIAVITEKWGGGTSNNAGSDKQTYYRVAQSGKTPDSAYEMAEDLFKGGCMHGDIALCEAAHSAEAFYRLVALGVPFPHNKYGSYAGYKTDHDNKKRGTSAGPLTSKYMFDVLSADVQEKGIHIFDSYQVIELLTENIDNGKKVCGALAINLKETDAYNMGITIFNCVNIVLGTGGPASIYNDSVYPYSQSGSHGLALRAGAIAHNLTESQFGIASAKYRWNLSGSYQQVLPRYVSTDQDGNDKKQFLNNHFNDPESLTKAQFLKGYQWPFDSTKIKEQGSSLIDLLVYNETKVLGRRVFLDYTMNPSYEEESGKFDISQIDHDAYKYLEQSSSLQDTPVERLKSMNMPAYRLFLDKGIDLGAEMLEISICAQHCNGGLKGSIWWESNVRNLFPVGEVNGTHGIYRPGGAALNSGQVGSQRAAMYISECYNDEPVSYDEFVSNKKAELKEHFERAKHLIDKKTDPEKIDRFSEKIKLRMSAYAGIIRNKESIDNAFEEAHGEFDQIIKTIRVNSPEKINLAFRLMDDSLTQLLFLESISEYLQKGGESRGSYICISDLNDILSEHFELSGKDDFVSNNILEMYLNQNMNIHKKWVDIRPVPDSEDWYEKVWSEYFKKEFFK